MSLQLEERQKSLSAAELEMNALTRWRSGLLINNIFMIIVIQEYLDICHDHHCHKYCCNPHHHYSRRVSGLEEDLDNTEQKMVAALFIIDHFHHYLLLLSAFIIIYHHYLLLVAAVGKLDKASTAADDSERAKKVLFSSMCRVVSGDKHQVIVEACFV